MGLVCDIGLDVIFNWYKQAYIRWLPLRKASLLSVFICVYFMGYGRKETKKMTEWQIVGRRPKYPDEAWVKKQVKCMFEALKEAGFGVWFFMPQGSNIGRVGIPDFVGCIEGVAVAIEAKKSGGEISKLQWKEIEALTYAKACAYIVDEYGLDTLWNALLGICRYGNSNFVFDGECRIDLRGTDDSTTNS